MMTPVPATKRKLKYNVHDEESPRPSAAPEDDHAVVDDKHATERS
jgi:hypothetical protein